MIPYDTSRVKEELLLLDRAMQESQTHYQSLLSSLHPSQYKSGLNLLHYLCLRSRETTHLQHALQLEGLSSLYGSEGYVQFQLAAIMKHLDLPASKENCDYAQSMHSLNRNNLQLLGNKEEDPPAIIVTFKSSFAHDFITVKKLLKAGMTVARINCAHDDEATWLNMISRVREASQFTGIPCKICMDLAGPKIRTHIKKKKGKIFIEEED
jgi:pyruvate kinase